MSKPRRTIDDEGRPIYRTHTVRPRETLRGIAKQFHVDIYALHQLNRNLVGPNPNDLTSAIGQKLTIPNEETVDG